MAKLNVRISEEYKTWVWRSSIEIDTDQYPELEGMTEDEMKEYIEDNAWDMNAPVGYDKYCSTLGEALEEQDVVNDKVSDSDTDIEFE